MVDAARTVAVSGATRGLGRALVASFAARGLRVAGCGRSDAAVAELARALPPDSVVAVADVADPDQVAAWARLTLARLGPPDLLVVNAAVMNRPAPLAEQSPAELARLFAVNVTGAAVTAAAFLPAMVARGRGVVVFVSSGWGRSVDAGVAPYCASKWALEGLARAVALEVPRGLAVVAVNPGIVATDMLRSCWADQADSFPAPATWARRAVPFLLALGPADNGRSLDVP